MHGGMGFIEETGAAQHYRDARILTIYEGTTGIQALDFIGRKTPGNQGAHLAILLDEMQQSADHLADDDLAPLMKEHFQQALEAGRQAHAWVLEQAGQDRALPGSVSVNFLLLFGYLSGGWMMARSALKAQQLLADNDGDPDYLKAKLVTARFYCEHLLPRALAHYQALRAGSDSIMALSNEQF
ncbi:MAG: acyl-CoA dehydrogenase [Thiolinea sp.]